MIMSYIILQKFIFEKIYNHNKVIGCLIIPQRAMSMSLHHQRCYVVATFD